MVQWFLTELAKNVAQNILVGVGLRAVERVAGRRAEPAAPERTPIPQVARAYPGSVCPQCLRARLLTWRDCLKCSSCGFVTLRAAASEEAYWRSSDGRTVVRGESLRQWLKAIAVCLAIAIIVLISR